MASTTISLIQEVNRLWDPVYPHLSRHIEEVYGRKDGNVLEIGPFCGVIFSLQENRIGNSFAIAGFPSGMGDFFRRETRERNQEDKIVVLESDPILSGIDANSIDLAIFRGAFFFPSLGEANLNQIYRVLKPKGLAFVGGGFGKHTPERVIADLAERSRDLNTALGKIRITEEKIGQMIAKMKVDGEVELITEGGLWVLMRKK